MPSRHPTSRTPLERKLELLEARFSQDPVGGGTSNASGGGHSQHSFSFDGVAMATTTSLLSSPTVAGGAGSAASGSQSHTNASKGFERLQRAAERHLSKVQKKVVVWASDSSNNSGSVATTLVTNQNGVSPETPQRRPQDEEQAPPLSQQTSSPAESITKHTANVVTATKKRKSVPVKHEQPTVKATPALPINSSALPPLPAAPVKAAAAVKETMANPPPTTTTVPTKARTSTTTTTTSSAPNRKRGRNRLTSSPPKERKKPTTNNTDTSNAVDPPTDSNHQNHASHGSPTRTSSSRDAGEGKKSRSTKAPLHNTTIRNFFLPRMKASSTSAKGSLTSPDRTKVSGKAAASTATTAATSTPPVARKLKAPTAAPVTPAKERLERRVKELEQQCADKDQQLKAVADNRTILHTALQTALAQKTKELEEYRTARRQWEGESRKALEKLVRDKATQETKEIRERLAADGARLGRITYARVGMRVVESWEEGFASTQLHARRHELKERKSLLLERLDKATKITSKIAVRESKVDENDAFDSAEDWNETDWTVGGIVVRNRMDAMEAKESVRFHLQTVQLEEKKVIAEEAALNEEKGAHVRALKRVASEDASRFKSRPKLHDRYLLKRLLGKGGFSEVWRAYDLVELREVAVKIHQLDPRWSDSKKENYTKHVSREYEIHRNVRHPRIVSLYDVFEIDNNSFATVLECCDGTDLDTLLKSRRHLPEKDARAILLQILSGMRYLSQPSEDGSRQGIIHYDLKPGNILFDEYGDAKITDFGLSKIVDTADTSGGMELTSQGAGTYWYLPPECFMTDDNIRISNKVDVWSIGVIFYQMIFGRRPFGDGQSQDAILNDGTVLNAHAVTFPEKITVTEGCKRFIQKCLTYDQSFRPTIAQLCQETYLLEEL